MIQRNGKLSHALGREELISLIGHKIHSIYRLMWTLSSYPSDFQQIILKFLWDHKRSRIVKIILRKKKKARSIILPDFRLHNKATVIKTVWYWHTHKKPHGSMEQNREPRNKSTHLQSINLQQRRHAYITRER